MLPRLSLVLFGLLLFGLDLWSATCLTTLPPNPPFEPPEAERYNIGRSFWYGNEALWTHLPLGGTWKGLPYRDDSKKYVQKLFWYSKDHTLPSEPKRQIVVTGRLLDGDSSSFAESRPANSSPSLGIVGIGIPSPGCWEITGYYNGHTLTYVISVEP
jgi:hypothetical protein